MESTDKEFVEKSWLELTMRLNETVADKWRSIICQMYSEPQRYYHTLAHVTDMLKLRDKYAELINDVEAVTYAIVFHDLVYEPKAKDNEERSAGLFEDFAFEADIDMLKAGFTNKVVKYILATKTHMATELGGDDSDLAIFLDFDMAVLGRQWDDYKRYTEQIRQEYIHLPDETFVPGRSKVLKSFLEMPHIYGSEILKSTFEIQARGNISKELQLLCCNDSP